MNPNKRSPHDPQICLRHSPAMLPNPVRSRLISQQSPAPEPTFAILRFSMFAPCPSVGLLVRFLRLLRGPLPVNLAVARFVASRASRTLGQATTPAVSYPEGVTDPAQHRVLISEGNKIDQHPQNLIKEVTP